MICINLHTEMYESCLHPASTPTRSFRNYVRGSAEENKIKNIKYWFLLSFSFKSQIITTFMCSNIWRVIIFNFLPVFCFLFLKIGLSLTSACPFDCPFGCSSAWFKKKYYLTSEKMQIKCNLSASREILYLKRPLRVSLDERTTTI